MNSQDVILGMLLKGPMSGYDMKQVFQSVFSYFYDASYGTIYPTLSRMEKDGLITKESVVQEAKPNKNVYAVTAQGRAAFMQYMHSEIEPESFRSDLLMRMFFGEFVDKEVVIGWFEREIDKKEQQYQQLSGGYQEFARLCSPTKRLCAEYGMESLAHAIQFLKKGLREIRALEV
ncbi:PadR family transcriptional regulator [Paenibacillus terrigena]|uniref:PadR family transcriptional regulator n=1 Tax=Paenibacillus terrigena TaxID=369333 RepID=UPI000362BC90|nr:PadR family transcriptional regulator [Paenibacillus terrigena]